MVSPAARELNVETDGVIPTVAARLKRSTERQSCHSLGYFQTCFAGFIRSRRAPTNWRGAHSRPRGSCATSAASREALLARESAVSCAAVVLLPGLWAKWKDPKSRGEVLSCTILTCAPNDVMAELHDRMPVVLAESDWPRWLGEEPATDDELLELLKPCPDEALEIWPVAKAVGNVNNTGPQLAMPV
jgi:hypothetical protein